MHTKRVRVEASTRSLQSADSLMFGPEVGLKISDVLIRRVGDSYHTASDVALPRLDRTAVSLSEKASLEPRVLALNWSSLE